MYKNIIFDLYGTLVDIHTNEKKAYLWDKLAEIYRAYGAYYSGSSIKAQYLHYVHLFESQMTGPFPEIQLELVFHQLAADRGVLFSAEQLSSIGIAFRTISRSYLRLYPDVIEVLETLKSHGLGIYLLSNAQHMFTESEMLMLGLIPFFDGILYSSDAGCKKPDPTFMQLLLTQWQLDPSSCIMIGNEAGSDIAIANACHMDSIYLHTNLSPAGETGCPQANWQISDGDHTRLLPLILASNSGNTSATKST